MWGRYLPHIPPLSLASGQMKMQIVPDSHGQNTRTAYHIRSSAGTRTAYHIRSSAGTRTAYHIRSSAGTRHASTQAQNLMWVYQVYR